MAARWAAVSCSERRLCFACRLRAGARREKKEKRNGVSLVTWLRRLSGEGFTGAAARGVAGGTVAGLGAGVGEIEQNRNFRFPNPEPPGFGAKQIQFWSAQN